ncbi:Hypothetical protein, putative [Bodo saltans]|uniref:Uncharacterized protein n=1 Tax=Bodo saltans TaxID=75058 RepID=A0A0S4JR55_BODSA|nr:Hypothetical protein, putative [Bodo saltans]|eukprot:CUG94019.1 Hypothetical protein, putative [Bodo saltans]
MSFRWLKISPSKVVDGDVLQSVILLCYFPPTMKRHARIAFFFVLARVFLVPPSPHTERLSPFPLARFFLKHRVDVSYFAVREKSKKPHHTL